MSPYVSGAVLFVVVVVIAVTAFVLRAKFGWEPPWYHAYFLAAGIFAAIFFLPPPMQTAVPVSDLEVASRLLAQQALAITRLTEILWVVLFMVATWIFSSKSRMARYLERCERKNTGVEADNSIRSI